MGPAFSDDRVHMARVAVSESAQRDDSVQAEPLTLANQMPVWIRSLRAGDDALIRELLVGLDPVSWYYRFLSPYPTALETLVPLLGAVNGQRGLTLIAERVTHGSTHMVGIANIAFSDAGTAEVGVVIGGAWQRQRLGTELARRALRAAEGRGIRQFVGYVTTQNVAARRFLSKVGVVRSVRVIGRVSEYWFSVRATEATG
jgi:RimJ/RimL family protein N-acetyltransferase